MAIDFKPKEMLKKIAPKKQVQKLVTQNLTVNRAALTMLTNSDVISKTKLENIALRVIKQYKEKYRENRSEGQSAWQSLADAINGKKLMVARVQNSVVQEITKDIKQEYRGEYYEWLPSDSADPDPEHQLNYGQVFQIGVGEMPGDRPGCRCGMRILVPEEKLAI